MITLRSVAERLSRSVVIKRRLPRDFASLPIFVSPECGLRYWRWNMAEANPELFALARRFVQPGMVVWDAGANVGIFAFSAAARGAKVIAIEPDLFSVQLMRRSQRLNGADVAILPVAISDRAGWAELHIACRARMANFLEQGSTQTGGTRWTETVPTVTLDSLLRSYPAPDLVKIDIELQEGKALAGAEQLLASKKATFICEVSLPNKDTVTSSLLRHGYKLIDLATGHQVPEAVWDTLAVPATTNLAGS